MDKASLILILDDCFKEDGNCVVFHFGNGSDMLVGSKPSFFNLHMSVDMEQNYNGDIVHEVVHIPYSVVDFVFCV